jgi:hypothetical protein
MILFKLAVIGIFAVVGDAAMVCLIVWLAVKASQFAKNKADT